MIVIPAIDLRGGQCVRLAQGRFDAETIYSDDPAAVVRRCEEEGATHVHIVDLDGAKTESAQQTHPRLDLVRSTRLKVQTGGGLRRLDQIASLLAAGVHRVVIGSLAVREPALTAQILSRFGGAAIVVALDVRVGTDDVARVESAGWQGGAKASLNELLVRYVDHGLTTILCTDIARDGMLSGPNTSLYRHLRDAHPTLSILASGGVGTLDDLRALREVGVAGAIVGRALYERRFTLREALATAHEPAGAHAL